MKYNKPEMVALAPAVEAIQGGTSKNCIVSDSTSNHSDTGAYEADE